MRLTTELCLSPKRLTFLDKAIPDTLPYTRLFGVDEKTITARAQLFLYRALSLCDHLPVEQDGLRGDTDEQHEWLEAETERVYAKLGYDIIRVPVMQVRRRMGFVLDRTLRGLDYEF